MRINWKSRNKLLGAAAFVFVAVPAVTGGLHKYDVTPSYKTSVTHVTPLAVGVQGIKKYSYIPGYKLSVRYLIPSDIPVVIPPDVDPGVPGGGGGALITGGHAKAYREYMLLQAREEDKFIIEAITAIIRVL